MLALLVGMLCSAVKAEGARDPNPRLHQGNPALHTAPAGAPDPYRPRLHHGNPAKHASPPPSSRSGRHRSGQHRSGHEREPGRNEPDSS